MPTTSYPAIGNVARISCQFTDENNTPADPTTVTAGIKSPSGTITLNTPTQDDVGAYHRDLLLDEPGVWTYWFTGTGAIVARSADNQIYVPAPASV